MKWFLLSLIFPLVYFFVKSKKAMHVLQQNWYNDGNRYLKWIFDNKKYVFLCYDLLIAIILLFHDKFAIYSSIVLFIMMILLYKEKIKKEQVKKPLVITARIKRLYVSTLLIYIVLLLPILIKYNNDYIAYYYLYVGLLIYLDYFIILLGNIVNKPVEKMVFNHFKRMAINKLNSNSDLKRVAVTGSYGKTSTKNAINDILNVKFNSFATPKSFNTMYGLMNAINNYMDKFSDIFVAEMGAFHNGEIKEKCDFIKPKYGVLTTIGTAHLESFGSRENIQKAKFELIDSLPKDGIAILNMDDEYQVNYKIKSKCKKVWISLKDKKADVYTYDISASSKGSEFTCKFKDSGKTQKFSTKLLGSANIYNITQAIALAYELGMDLEQIAIGVKRIETIEHRLEMKKYFDINLIDDAYNSNPVGAKMAVDVLDMMDGKKIIVTPGMIEMGDKQYEYNMEFGRQIAKVCDEVILVGKEQTKPIYDGLIKEKYDEKKIHVLNDVKDAFPLMRKLSDKKTYVLLENDLPDIFNE